MSNSEVFDEFIKIAMKKGLVSEGEHAEHTEQNTKNPRWDSLDISAIEALYGVKPDQSKDMDYEHNIMEVAHPNAVVVSPSYDKLNGLVENNNELQNILMHILYKEPESGSPNQGIYPMRPTLLYPNPKYASKNLMLALVRVANDMDNKDKDDLRVLADKCLEQIHDGFQKQAFLPWIIGAAVVLGAIYLQQHLDDVDQGIKQNYMRLQSELQDFQQADTTLGFGHKYDDTLKHDVMMLQSSLNEFWTAYSKALPLIQEMERPTNAQDLIQKTQNSDTMTVMQAYETLRGEVEKIFPYLYKTQQNFTNPDYKAEHTAEKGAITGLLDSVPFLHGGKSSLTADDFDDVINAIGPFMASVKRLLDLFAKAKNVQDKISADLAASTGKTQSFLGPDTFKNPSDVTPKEKTVEDIDQESSGIGDMLSKIMPNLGR
jgi:hypothetical protein